MSTYALDVAVNVARFALLIPEGDLERTIADTEAALDAGAAIDPDSDPRLAQELELLQAVLTFRQAVAPLSER